MRISDWSSDVCSSDLLGSIVLIKRDAVPDATVVDGQQRLTTLTLLMSAIRSVVVDPRVRAGITRRIYDQGDVVTATENHYRVSLRERDRQFFRDYVQHEGGIEKLVALNDTLPDSQARLRANAHLFIDRSEEHTSELQSLMSIPFAVFYFK